MKRLLSIMLIALLLAGPVAHAQDPAEKYLAWTLAGSHEDQVTLQMQILEAGLLQDYIDHAMMTWINGDTQIVLWIYYPAEMDGQLVFRDILCTLGVLYPDLWDTSAEFLGCGVTP